MEKTIYLVTFEEQIYGPANEDGLKPLEQTRGTQPLAFASFDAVEKYVEECLKLGTDQYGEVIGRYPESRHYMTEVEGVPEALESYIAWNLSKEEAEAVTRDFYLDGAVEGGALEICLQVNKTTLME